MNPKIKRYRLPMDILFTINICENLWSYECITSIYHRETLCIHAHLTSCVLKIRKERETNLVHGPVSFNLKLLKLPNHVNSFDVSRVAFETVQLPEQRNKESKFGNDFCIIVKWSNGFLSNTILHADTITLKLGWSERFMP